MWKILELVIFCGLLNPLRGREPGIRSAMSSRSLSKGLLSVMRRNEQFQSHLLGMTLPDIVTGGGGQLGELASIHGLHVVSVQISGISMMLLPGTGIDLFMSTQLNINGNAMPALSSLVSIMVDMKSQARYRCVDFSAGTFKILFEECSGQLGAIEINLSSGEYSDMDRHAIQDSLNVQLTRQICAVVKAILDMVTLRLLGTVNVDLQMGTYGRIKYRLWSLPDISSSHVGIYVDTEVLVPGRGILSIPNEALPINVPSIDNFKICQRLHLAFLDIVLSALFREPLELMRSPDEVPDDIELRNAFESLSLRQDSEDTSRITPPSDTLYLQISLTEDPVVVAGSDKAVLRLTGQIKLVTRNMYTSASVVITIRNVLDLDTRFSVVSNRLMVAVSLSSYDLYLESSESNNADVPTLTWTFSSFLRATFVYLLNGRLSTGIPLPRILGIALTDANIQISPDAVVLCV
ncbi:BPI fold-containing family B member 4-like [Hemicordylus capensis]|uniref:BPI fold-containing family B member 4-like n=1 Tax=Hemicordylus capensis TaxID=884348 RepID=UPI002304A61F|nr:BPI fold-containing family B member 4-like [Hemicordylus capensis]